MPGATLALVLAVAGETAEPPIVRAVRLLELAHAVDAEAGGDVPATRVLALMWHETRLLPQPENGTPDVGGRAYCYGEVHKTPLTPEAPEGARDVRTCARLVVRVLRYQLRCGSVAGSFHGYGTGSCSRTPARWAYHRAWTADRWAERVAAMPERAIDADRPPWAWREALGVPAAEGDEVRDGWAD